MVGLSYQKATWIFSPAHPLYNIWQACQNHVLHLIRCRTRCWLEYSLPQVSLGCFVSRWQQRRMRLEVWEAWHRDIIIYVEVISECMFRLEHDQTSDKNMWRFCSSWRKSHTRPLQGSDTITKDTHDFFNNLLSSSSLEVGSSLLICSVHITQYM
jgi:hypothetical protein